MNLVEANAILEAHPGVGDYIVQYTFLRWTGKGPRVSGGGDSFQERAENARKARVFVSGPGSDHEKPLFADVEAESVEEALTVALGKIGLTIEPK